MPQNQEPTADQAKAIVEELRQFGATLQKWFPELNAAEQFPIERMRHIAREYHKLRREREAMLPLIEQLGLITKPPQFTEQ